MKNIRKRIVYLLLCAIFVSLVWENPTQAAVKCSLNRKNLTLKVGKTFVLKVKGTKRKVKWSSSDPKVASVSAKAKGKGKVKAKKTGSCNIIAKVGKKKMLCRVKVKKANAGKVSTTPSNAGAENTPVSHGENTEGNPGSIQPGNSGEQEKIPPQLEDEKEKETPTTTPNQPGGGETGEETPTTTPDQPGEGENEDNNLQPGVYDENGNLLKSWETMILDEEVDVYSENGEVILGYYGCQVTGALYVPDNITTIVEKALYQCETIREIHFAEGIVDIGSQAFEGCQILEKVEFGSSLETVGTYAFSSCENLKSVQFVGDKLIEIKEGTFSECGSLEQISIPPGVKELGMAVFDGCVSLCKVTIPEGVEKIGSVAFADCTGIETLYVPETVKEIGELAFLNVAHIDYHGVIEDEAEDTNMWGAVSMN